MIFAHPYREAQVTASVYDEFAKQASLSFKSARTSRSLDLARGPISRHNAKLAMAAQISGSDRAAFASASLPTCV